MKENIVTVVMPTYNCASFINEAIASVRRQSFQNWELLVVDDCSLDDTASFVGLHEQQDHRVHYFVLPENSGAAAARNFGVAHASGEFIAFLDSDDVWLTDKLEKQIAFMRRNDYHFTFTAYEEMDEQGMPTGRAHHALEKVNYNRVLLNCPIGNSSVVYNCAKLGKIEIPNIRKRNDDALWLKLLKIEPYAYGLDEVLMKYRIRNNSLSRNKLELVAYHWYLYRNIENLSVIRSTFHILYWGLIKIFRLK